MLLNLIAKAVAQEQLITMKNHNATSTSLSEAWKIEDFVKNANSHKYSTK